MLRLPLVLFFVAYVAANTVGNEAPQLVPSINIRDLLANSPKSASAHADAPETPSNAIYSAADPKAVVCPTPIMCASGLIGRDCDQVVCTSKGSVTAPPTSQYAIDKMAYSADLCSAKQSRAIPIDSHVTTLYVFVDGTQAGANPSVSVMDANGQQLTGTVLQNDTKTIEYQYPVNNRGYYVATFSASTACHFMAFGMTDLSLSGGFTSGPRARHSDDPQPTINQFSLSYLIGHVNNLPTPGRAVAVEIYENANMLSAYQLQNRFRCAYEQYAGPVICRAVDIYWYKVYGFDENGNDFERVADIRCVSSDVSTTTAMPPTTSYGTTLGPGNCQHGGFPVTNGTGCYCPPEWTGQYCQNIVCSNGGTPTSDQQSCTCANGYSGQFCNQITCSSTNTASLPGPNYKSLIFVVQNTQSMTTDANALRDYVTTLVDEFVEHHTQYITFYALIVFNDQYDSVAFAGANPASFIASVHNFFMSAGIGKCKKPVLTGLQTALRLSKQGGHIYVLTDSPYSEGSSTTVDVYNRMERTGARVSFIVTPPLCGQPSDYKLYNEIAMFSGGDYFTPTSKRAVSQILHTIPMTYMSARVYERRFDDCTNIQNVYVAIDSHTAAFTVTVYGNLARAILYAPEGMQFQSGDDVVNDPNIKVVQAITPCGAGWDQHGYECYYGVIRPRTWIEAQAECKRMGGHLANIFNGDKQTFLNYETHGLNYWMGLNDMDKEGQFMWDGPVPLGLDPYFTNWAPGQPGSDPLHQRNCVSVQHTIVNGTATDAKWVSMGCQQSIPFVCQKHAYDFNSNRLPAGFWNVAVLTNNGGMYNASCTVKVRAQTDLQVFAGFSNDMNSDFPNAAPSGSGNTNYVMANVTIPGAHFDYVDFFASNGTMLNTNYLVPRQNCLYGAVSKQAFQCPSTYYSLMFHGHDDLGYQFNRILDTLCIGS